MLSFVTINQYLFSQIKDSNTNDVSPTKSLTVAFRHKQSNVNLAQSYFIL